MRRLAVLFLTVACSSSSNADPNAPSISSFTVSAKPFIYRGDVARDKATFTVIARPGSAGSPLTSAILTKGDVTLASLTSSSPNTFVGTVPWKSLSDASLESAKGGTASVTVQATVFDQAGGSGSSTLDVTLGCYSEKMAICGGECHGLDIDPKNCGACGKVCGGGTFPAEASCGPGTCTLGCSDGCGVVPEFRDTSKSCTELCASIKVDDRPLRCTPTCKTGGGSPLPYWSGAGSVAAVRSGKNTDCDTTGMTPSVACCCSAD
jgi:hypothetical protein